MLFLSFLASFALPFLAARFLANRKHLRWQNKRLAVLLATLLPVVGLPYLLLRRNRFRGLTAEGKAVKTSEDLISYTKWRIKKQEKRVNRLSRSNGIISNRRLRRASDWLESLRYELQEQYLTYGIAQKRQERAAALQKAYVRVERNKDGSLRFVLPYDITREQIQELKGLIEKNYGINPELMSNVCIGEFRGRECNHFGKDVFTLEFDMRKHTLKEYGNVIDGDIQKKIKDINDSFVKKVNGIDDISLDRQNCLRLTVLGERTVALSMNGVELAFAVAGEDGRLLVSGTNAVPGDRSAQRIVAGLQKSLATCFNIDQWVSKAGDICLSKDNLSNAARCVREEYYEHRSRQEQKKYAKGLLVAPGVNLRNFARKIG